MDKLSTKIIYLLFGFIFLFLIIKRYRYYFLTSYRYLYNLNEVNWNTRKFSNCNIKFLDKIPSNSTLIVGHSYGSSSNDQDKSISTKLQKFLDSNKENIELLFLTGDVFEYASKEKWQNLNNRYREYFEIVVAPGNHDDGIRELKEFGLNFNGSYQDYPFSLNKNNLNFFIEDSFSENWRINEKLFSILNNSNNYKKNILLRHNILIKEFLPLANSREGLSSYLPTIDEISKRIDKETIIISGDTGASIELPSFFCRRYKSLTIIANGIGDFKKDIILIISRNNLYRYKL